MKKLRLSRGILLGILLTVLIAVPVLAGYYAYITVTESLGNPYTQLPLLYSYNVSTLADEGLISATGLDTRIYNEEEEALPHMLTDGKIAFVTDLDAYEEQTLTFSLGESSLSSFPLIVGRGGYVTTPDDNDLELTYNSDLIFSGFFDASSGSSKYILYKEDAFGVYISAANTLKVVAGEAWSLEYDNFTTGSHTVRVVIDGLAAFLYIDSFDIPKDTLNLYNGYVSQFDVSYDARFMPYARKTFYANGRYWAFYTKDYQHDTLFYRTSTDGQSWAAAIEIVIHDITTNYFEGFSTWYCPDTDLFHIAYGNVLGYTTNSGISYRAGTPNANGTISWETDWQKVSVSNGSLRWAVIACDSDGYPYIRVRAMTGTTSGDSRLTKSSRNDGIWATAAGYPKYNGEVAYNDRGCLIGYPDSNKMYLLEVQSGYGLRGRYYNGVTWSGSWEYFDDTASSCMLDSINCIADMDDNVVAVWRDGPSGCGQIHLRVRYADASFSNTVELTSTLGSSPTISYDIEQDLFYIYWVYDGVSVYVQVFDLDLATISMPYFLGTPTSLWAISAAPYNNIGVLCIGASSTTTYTMCDLYWTWNDNSSNWYWMLNNVMPYASYFDMTIDESLELRYKPDSLISGTTLPDESGSGHPGIITWGNNPSGVEVSMGDFQREVEGDTSDELPSNLLGIPGVTDNPDMFHDTGASGDAYPGESLPGGPFIYEQLQQMDVPMIAFWGLLATVLSIAAGVITFNMSHGSFVLTAFAPGFVLGLFSVISGGLIPWWTGLLFGVPAAAIVIYKRVVSL